jgi:16S rRNA (uracil1498-N3)-methyltransferase
MMRRFYAPPANITETGVFLYVDETRHLRDVLRLREGDEAAVFDGEGREYSCRIDEITKTRSHLTILRAISPAAPESSLDLILAAAMLKGEKFDLVVQKAVELGIYQLIPLETARGDVKPKDAAKRLDRWRRIALEATKQCGRARLMKINAPMAFQGLINDLSAEDVVLFSERDGDPFSRLEKAKHFVVLIGPEGGWDDVELDAARSRGIRILTLGGRILRAETAAISIAAIVQHRFGDLN